MQWEAVELIQSSCRRVCGHSRQAQAEIHSAPEIQRVHSGHSEEVVSLYNDGTEETGNLIYRPDDSKVSSR